VGGVGDDGGPPALSAQVAAAPPPPAPESSWERAGEMLELVLSATNDGVMDWNLVTGEIRYSERWKTLLGYEKHELDDSPALWRELSHPDDLPQVEAALRDHLENQWPLAHTWRMKHKNGGWRWSLCRAVTLQNSENAPFRCVSVFTDVTDQVLAEQRLSELTRRNELLLGSAGEGFLGIDVDATISFANPAAAQLLGCQRADLVGNAFFRVVPHGCPSDRACTAATCPIMRPFADGSVNRGANGTFGRKDGSAFAVDYVCTPAREDARVVGVVLTFRDVTEQRRIEAQLLQGQKLEAIGQLAAGIAHEINTPMQYIGDNTSFLDTGFQDLMALVREYRDLLATLAVDPAQADLVARATAAEETADVGYLEESIPTAVAAAQEGIARVRKIVYAMKEFSHPGHAEKKASDLNRGIESTLTISAATWKHVAVVETDLDPALPPVTCHLDELNQVVLNLIVNAAHAIGDVAAKRPDAAPGVIGIRTLVKDGFAEIRVTDTGGGIPEHVRHRIFEPFFTTKEVGRGTGQGLTLARSVVVEKHGGYLNFTTELGKGTTFVVGLPLS
jgi:PAS domain S-box-containing protein